MPIPTTDKPLPHPAWKIVHALVFFGGLIWMTHHGADLDGGGAGAVGLGAGARLAWLQFFTKC